MKTRLIYLFMGFALLFTLSQCKDSITQTNDNQQTELNTPSLLSPESNSDQTSSITFQWKKVKQARSYHFQLSGKKNFSSTIVDSISDSTDVYVQDLPFDTTLYWKVRPITDNSTSSWSEIWNFKVTSKGHNDPQKVTLISPKDDAEGVPAEVKLKWEKFKNTDKFKVQTATDKNFNNLVVNKTIEGLSQTASLDNSEDYFWRVKPVIPNKDDEVWSEVYSFTTKEAASNALPAPALVTPEDEATGIALQPGFEWKAVDGADSYILHVSHGDQMIIEQQVDGTSFTPSKKLSGKTTYYWRVRAVQNGTKGDWSGTNSFTTKEVTTDPLPAPALVSPQNEATDVALKPDFKWKAVDGADAYTLHVSYGDQMVIEQQVDGTSFTPSEKFSSETTYYWRVRALQNGTEGDWSTVNSFTTKTSESTTVPPVNLISPSDGAGNQPTTITFEWEPVSNISDYKIELAKDNSFSSAVVSKVISNTSFEVSGLDYSQTYYWRVQASGDGDSQNWSPVWSLTTEDQPVDNGGSTVSERDVLMELYNSTGGDYWTNNSGWGQGDLSGDWHGIQVNSQGQVTRIDLFDNNLDGQLPESIGELKHVKYFNVKGNKLTGPIPQSIGGMESLEYLILSGRTYEIGGTLKEPPEDLNYAYHSGKHSSSTNRFSGTIPSSVGNLSNLMFLEISDQPDITGPLPSEIGNLSNLKGLYLNMLDLDGYEIPRSFKNLTELRHFYMSSSDVVGSLPDVSNMTELRWFIITSSESRGKGLTGELPDMRNLTKLRGLFLNNNELEGPYPSYFNNGNFTSLHTIGFSWNNLTGTLHGFNNLPRMESLTLSGNQLSGDLKMLVDLPDRIQIISLGWNNFSGELPQSGWPDFWQLKTLYLNDNDLTGAIPCDFWNKIDNPRLGYAWLKNNEFTSNCTSAMNNVDGNGDPNISVGGNNF